MHKKNRYYQLKNLFEEKSINYSYPGFYDEKEFTLCERENPLFLENYAAFVNNQQYSQDYINRVEHIITKIAQIIYQELKKSNQQGRCIDASLAFSQVLNKEMIWNYVVRGALAIEFKMNTELKKANSYLYYYDIKETIGHSWLCIPPFKIVDLTISLQRYTDNQKLGIKYLPKILIEKNMQDCQFNESNIFSPELRLVDDINEKCEYLLTFQNEFKPLKKENNSLIISYYPCAITAPNTLLENNTAFNLNGNSAFEIYKKIIYPKIHNINE